VPDLVNALNINIRPISWIVRTQVPPQSLSNAIQDALRQSAGLPVSDVESMDTIRSLSISRQRFNMWVMTVFGACALLLAAIGIYGLMAYSVEQRTQEIGIRMALGAQAGSVRTMVVRQGMILAVVGIAIGLGSSFGLARLIQAFLFGVTPRDTLTFSLIPVLLAAVALLAVWIPASRASKVDPIIALRYE
jgi:ABC-type antimicrobial peptide transport system permease subunit